jgi:hypothetical protein
MAGITHRVAFIAVLVLILTACGGGGGGSDDDGGGGATTTTTPPGGGTTSTTTTIPGSGPTSTTTTTARQANPSCPNNSYSRSDYSFLYALNAGQLSGHTIRWASVPVGVSAPEYPSALAAFGRWAGASGGRVSFSGGSNITVRKTSTSSWCGLASVSWNSAGRITLARIQIAADQSRCSGGVYDTIAHEAGHAIGFLGHTSGGLMNPFGGTSISGQESTFASMLYSFPPGTDINPCLSTRSRSGYSRYDPRGRRTYSITIE